MSIPAQSEEPREAASGLGETLGHSLIERIGNTPLLRLDALTADLPGVALLGKAEWYNPGGSVKDRAAANIVADARRRGQLSPGKILLDATSGNTGIAYAMLGAAEDFPSPSACRKMFPANANKSCTATAPTLFIPIPPTVPTAPFEKLVNWHPNIPINTSTPISIPTTPTGRLTITAPLTKSGSRPRDESRISSPCSAPAALLSGPLAA